ncbi:MAG: citrate/2-methylcitrate synthase [Coriobacteriales bacterium]|jgi:citrate synthase|nr:citrate/2-methylcitrate synthase [Coriobacteriales bacterium]
MKNRIDPTTISLYDRFLEINAIDPAVYNQYQVKRGLRNDDGTGVVAGVTNISNVHGYILSDHEKVPDVGVLTYRGYNIEDLLSGTTSSSRYCFEEICYLLLNGDLPTQDQLERFIAAIDSQRELPDGFTAHYIMHPPTADLMNCLARSVLMLYANDPRAEDRAPDHEILTAISLLSRLPRISVLGYYAKRVAFFNESMIMHRFIPGQSTAETILSMLRLDRSFTPEEARMLDILLCLHSEHGGGNNSTFTCRVLTSTDTDPYSTYAAALGSLKGSRHGGANAKVLGMQKDLKEQVANWENDDEVADYLRRLLQKEAFDHAGLIYGMGHAVYTLSDPRATICREFATHLASGTEHEAELNLLKSIERLAPEVIAEVKGTGKQICANVDMYSGFVYSILGIPEELITPLFACARMAGWAAHRFEEIVSGRRIIRPAYKSAHKARTYLPINQRG